MLNVNEFYFHSFDFRLLIFPTIRNLDQSRANSHKVFFLYQLENHHFGGGSRETILDGSLGRIRLVKVSGDKAYLWFHHPNSFRLDFGFKFMIWLHHFKQIDSHSNDKFHCRLFFFVQFFACAEWGSTYFQFHSLRLCVCVFCACYQIFRFHVSMRVIHTIVINEFSLNPYIFHDFNVSIPGQCTLYALGICVCVCVCK